MKISEHRKDILGNVLAGILVVHYGAILANLIFFSNNGLIGAGFNLILFIIWIVITIRTTKKL